MCSCVSFSRFISPFPLKQVEHADDIPVNDNIPNPGDWILFHPGEIYSVHGHSAVIMAVGTSTLKIIESNFRKCQITVREISRWDRNIKGFFSMKYFAVKI